MSEADVVKNFSSTDLAQWIHDLPRYNHTLDRVTSDFTYDDRQYYEGVLMMLIPFLAMAVITILFFLIRCIIVCAKCCCHKQRKYQPKPKILIYVFLVTCLIVIGGLIYGFIANQQVSKGIDEIRLAIDNMKTFGDDSVDSVRIIRTQVGIVDDKTGELATFMQTIEQAVGASVGSAQIQSIRDLLSSAGTVLDSGISQYEDIPLDEVNARMNQYDGYRWGAQLGLLLFLSTPYWMVLIGIGCKCKCLVWNVTWVSVLCAIVAWVLSAGEVAVTVILGDLCFNATGYALDRGNDLGQSVFDFIEYYVICAGIPNPLQSEIDTADDALGQIATPINELLVVLADPNLLLAVQQAEIDSAVDLVVDVSRATNITIIEVRRIIRTVLRCEVPHNQLVRALDGVCNTALSGFFGLIVVQVVLALCVWTAIVCSLYMTAYLKNASADEPDANPGGLEHSLSFMYGKPAEAAPLSKEVELPVATGNPV